MTCTQANGRILIVDDEIYAARVLSEILTQEGFDVFTSRNTREAIDELGNQQMDAVITDVRMPGEDGTALHSYMKLNFPEIPVIFLTAYGTIDSAVNAMNSGVFYYFVKPPDYGKLIKMVSQAVEHTRLRREVEDLKQQLSGSSEGRIIIGKSPVMVTLLKTIKAIADSNSSVLITGETGTGKELVARALHEIRYGQGRPFVAVNCAAIPRELIEAELFGYEKGAFTGAITRRIGKFEQADGGTLFFDEIGELAPRSPGP